MSDTPFPQGISWFEPHKNAPAWIKGKITIDIRKFFKYAEKHQVRGGFLYLDVKESKNKVIYLSLSDYNPDKKAEPKGDDIVPTVQITEEDSQIPF